MTELGFARRVASTLVVGHVILFLFGFVVAVGGHLTALDVGQLALMASPMLLAIARPAFIYVTSQLTRRDGPNDPPVHRGTARLIMFAIYSFFAALVVLYSLGLFRSGMTPDQIKIGVGVVETALGGYLGTIRQQLFPDPPRQIKDGATAKPQVVGSNS